MFVYGSLRDVAVVRRAIGHGVSEDAAILPGYDAIRRGEWPHIVRKRGAEVKGDVFEVDERDLQELDSWESHYHRIEVQTSAGPAWVYVLRGDRALNAREDVVELKPIPIPRSALKIIESRIRKAFLDMLYVPAIEAFDKPADTIKNAAPTPIIAAIESGTIIIDLKRGIIHGEFNAKVTKALLAMGATWRRSDETFQIDVSKIPFDIRSAVDRSESHFRESLARCDAILADIDPAKIADAIKVSDVFDSTLFRIDRQLVKTLPEHITVMPELTADQRKRIAVEWQYNMDKWIRDFSTEEITRLRSSIQKNVMAGHRWQAAVKSIQRSYGVTRRKAEFLAQQETGLLIAKFKEARYTDAGSEDYKWSCVHMPHDSTPSHHTPGNVRYSHGILDGTIHRWDSPPVTTNPGQPIRRNNPGCDFRCRCIAVPRIYF